MSFFQAEIICCQSSRCQDVKTNGTFNRLFSVEPFFFDEAEKVADEEEDETLLIDLFVEGVEVDEVDDEDENE